MRTIPSILTHPTDHSTPCKRLEPIIILLAAIQFLLAFAGYLLSATHPSLGLVLTLAPIIANFAVTLTLCILYTRECHERNPISFYLMYFFTALITPAAILLLTTLLISLLP